MDWKYVLSLSPDNLTEDEKDHLYGILAWFDCEGVKLDQTKSVALFKISQEIMKYKAEQVEALLAELDEAAARLAEEEARRSELLDDKQSIKSKKSPVSSEYDDLEEKLKSVKSKLKQQNKLNDAQKKEIEKLNGHISSMEQEKLHLQEELRSVLSHREDSQSDASESVTEQHKELVHLVQQKNKQISQLLLDIEDIEAENLNLRERLSSLRDELQGATIQVTSMTDEFSAMKVKINDDTELLQSLRKENEALQSQIQDFVEEKRLRESQIDQFTSAVDSRVDKWKAILQDKDEEIQKLRLQLQQAGTRSSESSLNSDADRSYAEVLNKVLAEREGQLLELQSQLQNATKEMDKSTDSLQKLNTDKHNSLRKINELSALVKDLKTQLKTTHQRCQELHDGIDYAESMAESKQRDLNEVFAKLKTEGKQDLANSLEQIQKLKSEARIRDKQIQDYVKILNKLQSSVDDIQIENGALRDKCGIPDDDDVDISGVLIKKRKQSRDLEKLTKQVAILEDEKLDLRAEVHRLNHQLSALSSQIVDSGGKPSVEITSSPKRESKTNRQSCGELVKENEALRKGLHEILESVQEKNDSSRKEIKSETLDKLLKALDARHISGWYHPAMRLQAELHTLQGANAELREQLKIARAELNTSQHTKLSPGGFVPKESKIIIENLQGSLNSGKDAISNLNSHLLNVLSKYGDEEALNGKLTEKLNEYHKNFRVAEQQMQLLYDQYSGEKKIWEAKEQHYQEGSRRLENQIAVLDAKLKEFLNTEEEPAKKTERFAEMSANMVILNRRCVFLENEESRLSAEAKELKSDLANAEQVSFEKLCQMRNEKNDLHRKLARVENLVADSVPKEKLMEVQSKLDQVTLRYRESLNSSNKIKTHFSNELVVLKETVKLLEGEKSEFQNNLLNALAVLHTHESVSATDDAELLSKKLAQTEVSEMAEKQRANHMKNLYELVKEQLQKSEQRLQEFEKYNQEILRNNLVLQENVKDLEEKLINFVEVKAHQDLQAKYVTLSEELGKLQSENEKLKSQVAINHKNSSALSLSASNDMEILNLKHQILDLQSSGDDKALIARLSSDVVHARLSETQSHKKLEELEEELKDSQHNYETCKKMLQQERLERENLHSQLQNKIANLELIIHHQRTQYLGSIPLILEEAFHDNLQRAIKDKQEAFGSLQNVRKQERECTVLKEQLNKQMQIDSEFKLNLKNHTDSILADIKAWHQERNIVLIKELKYQKELDFKNMQLEQISYRLNSQDELILRLQEELLQCYQKYDFPLSGQRQAVIAKPQELGQNQGDFKLTKLQETQTDPELLNSLLNDNNFTTLVANLQAELNKATEEIKEKNGAIEQCKVKANELEMNLSLFRTQIGDKQSQITFYEKHILELQNKLSKVYDEPAPAEANVESKPNPEEILALKNAIKSVQEANAEKDEALLKYQTLLKKDRDEHSLAAARMQQKMKQLQEVITVQEKRYNELSETSYRHPGKAAIEQYILQVHALEKHTSDLHTNVSTLNSQLQASRQEAARWQTLANERLDSMEQLRIDLEEQHKLEIGAYKMESDRWRDEIAKLKELMNRYRTNVNSIEPQIQQSLNEKNEKIEELTNLLKQARAESNKRSSKSESTLSQRVTELESTNEQLSKDMELLKKRYEQTLARERSAKEEVYALKEQLLKKPLSARGDKGEKEQHLQRKINSLEKEVDELKSKLEKQSVISEAHKLAVTDDFEKWKKQKHLQQMAQRYKDKLKEKSDEFDKLSQTCSGYKILVERLEREKQNLENKLRNMRVSNRANDNSRADFLSLENEKLRMDLANLGEKLLMQQRQAGGLGAAMLQEKFEGQERKIALLEMTSKGNSQMRAELERLQNSNENLQKLNLRLEAENLELKLDSEKFGKEAPRLREQIQHLETYIEVLKTENENKDLVACEKEAVSSQKPEKKVAELERTVFILKRVVEKLQAENKRLQNSTNRPCSTDRSAPSENLRVNYHRLKEQYGESIQKVASLEEQLKNAHNKITLLEKRPLNTELNRVTDDLARVKAELAQKCELLDKVKVLLHRAAIKEKALLEEMAALKLRVPAEDDSPESHSV